ncbi:MAG: hypothetical protein BWY50_00686 [Spirochaetes bacterium ADurb.Bin315]|jgi:hypothetical protein|nr:MAG: hypothetical protein BWY50_00686 [Spirochaetes bacterium ADurb.Bin315]
MFAVPQLVVRGKREYAWSMDSQVKKPKKDRRRGNRRNRKAKGSQKKVEQEIFVQPSEKKFTPTLPPLPVKKVVEPKEVCVMCKKPITLIANALTHPQGGYCHFDCVLGFLTEREQLKENQTISYIGRGMFAVAEKNSEGSYTFVKRIEWESPESFAAMKKYVEEMKA